MVWEAQSPRSYTSSIWPLETFFGDTIMTEAHVRRGDPQRSGSQTVGRASLAFLPGHSLRSLLTSNTSIHFFQ